MGRGHQGHRRKDSIAGAYIMVEGVTGWRLHVGVIFPTPIPPRAIREWYEVVPDGVDITCVSLTIQQLTDDDMEEALKGMERAAKQLANFDVEVIYQAGVPPVVARGPAVAGLRAAGDHRHERGDRGDAGHEVAHARDGDAVPAVHQRAAGEVS